jgi:hypothetical protein
MPPWNGEAPAISAGVVELTNENPLIDCPGINTPAVSTHRSAKPSPAAVPLVVTSTHPVGAKALIGAVCIKPWPGSHENQNVPMGVVPVSVRVKLYCQVVGESWLTEYVALAISLAARGSDQTAQRAANITTLGKNLF